MILWGWKSRVQTEQRAKQRECPACHQKAWVLLVSTRKRYHVFWIPVTGYWFPGPWFMQCEHCGTSAELWHRERVSLQEQANALT